MPNGRIVLVQACAKSGGEEQRAYYRVKPAHRALVAVAYVGLIAALVFGMAETHVVRTFADA